MVYRGGASGYPHGIAVRSYSSNISRTDTTARSMFVLPPKTVISDIRVIGPASNAGGEATISLGSDGGGGTDFLANLNVKAGTVSRPSDFGATAGAGDTNWINIEGVYAEDGGASTVGGPWTIYIETIGQER